MIRIFFAVIYQNLIILVNFLMYNSNKKRNISVKNVLGILFFLIVSSWSFLYIGKFAVFSMMVACILIGTLILKNNIIESLNAMNVAYIVSLVIDYSVVFILTIFENKYDFYTNDFLYVTLSGILVLTVNWLLSKKIDYLGDMILAFVLTFINLFIHGVNIILTDLTQNSITLLVILFLFVLIIFFAITVMSIYYKRRQREYTYQYYKELENNYNDIREFRHDYKNIIQTLGILVQQNNMEEVKKFYESLIQDSNQESLNKSRNLEKLSKIENGPLRGFIFSKIREAEIKNVKVFVEVSDPIEEINMGQFDLIRVLGILLDNAIEEVESLEKGTVGVVFIQMDFGVVIIIENDCREDIEDLYKLRERNFSTKGPNRGLGLSIVENILGKLGQVNHETLIEKGKFIQKIQIRKKS